MFTPDQSISYLSETAAEVKSEPQQPVQKIPQPQVNQAIDMENPHFQSYPQRADIAPYMSRYIPPTPIRQHQIDVLGSTDGGGSSFKTGLLLSSLLLVGSVTGYSLEKTIGKNIKPKGYGAIMGSLSAVGLYYVFSRSMAAGLIEGGKAAGGFIIPMIPLFVGIYQGKALDRTTSLISAGVGVLGSSYVILSRFMK